MGYAGWPSPLFCRMPTPCRFVTHPDRPRGPMSEPDSDSARALHDRINREMIDSFDEELEMEIDDDRLAKLLTELSEHPEQETMDRRVYFKELFRLQGELVKLQDWIVRNKLEGGRPLRRARRGRQRRGHQAHHPADESSRVPRRGVAGSERARTHAVVFPALCGAPTRRRRDRPLRSQLVQPRRR